MQRLVGRICIYDYVVAVAAFMQPLQVVIQQILLDVVGLEMHYTTLFRVFTSGIVMSFAIFVAANRSPRLFVSCYFLILLVFLLSAFCFPLNILYIKSHGLRFLLPIVLPTVLCITTITDFSVIKRVVVAISWCVAILVCVYWLCGEMGFFNFEGYNMSVAYAALMPMCVLWQRGSFLSMLIAVLLSIFVLFYGNRGAIVAFASFVLFDSFRRRHLRRLFVFLFMVLCVWIGTLYLNVTSRSLELLHEHSFIGHSSGRGEIYAFCINSVLKCPVLGYGLFGDRVLLSGAYCHNILLELWIDFGLIIGSFIAFYLFRFLIRTYRCASGEVLDLFTVLLFLVFPQFFVSSSFLINSDFALLLGFCYWILKNKVSVNNAEYESTSYMS